MCLLRFFAAIFMNILSREDLRNQLRQDKIAPVYLLFGAEKFLRDLAAKTITEKVLADSPLREFNETTFSLNNTEIQHALASAEQLPMVSPRRVVLITDINKLKEEDEGALARYLARPAETSVVIFIADELDKRRRFVKNLLDNSVAAEFTLLSDAGLTDWAKGKLKEFNAQADDLALRQLIALVGNNVLRLTNEIEKLAVAALPDSIITFDLVENLVPNSRELNNFDLTDYLLSKNRARALQMLRKILSDGAEPLMLLGLIAANFRRLFLAKELMSQGVDRSEVARIIKLPYRKQEDFLANARRAETENLSWILRRIGETDLAIKTSKGGSGASGARLQIEILVCELVG